MASAICSFVTDQACFLSVTGLLAHPPPFTGQEEISFFSQNTKPLIQTKENVSPQAFKTYFRDPFPFSMYNTLERIIRESEYFSCLKEGYKMTIL